MGKHPQKSDMYKIIGLIRASNRCIIISGYLLKYSPILLLSKVSANTALDFKSFSPELISPDGVIKNPGIHIL